jgi:hypothetical protein
MAEKRRALRLNNTPDVSVATRSANLARAIIDAVVILVAAVLIERIAVGAVGQS